MGRVIVPTSWGGCAGCIRSRCTALRTLPATLSAIAGQYCHHLNSISWPLTQIPCGIIFYSFDLCLWHGPSGIVFLCKSQGTSLAVQGLRLCTFLFFFFYKFIYLFIYFWPCWVFIAAHGLSFSCGKRGLLFVAVRGLLIVMASLVAEHGL